MRSESQKRAAATHRARKIEAGWKQKVFLLSPAAVERLAALKDQYGSEAQAVEALLLGSVPKVALEPVKVKAVEALREIEGARPNYTSIVDAPVIPPHVTAGEALSGKLRFPTAAPGSRLKKPKSQK